MYFSQQTLQKLDKRIRIHKAIDAAAVIAALCVCVLLCVFANHGNKNIMLVVSCVVAVAVGWFAIADVYLVILPSKYQARHVEAVNGYEKTRLKCKVVDIKKVTVTKWIAAYEAVGEYDGSTLRLYWNENAGELPFAIGDTVSAVCANGFIISCEVFNE